MKYHVAPKGKHTVYIEHGVWYDHATKRIHVTVPGVAGAHWSYGKSDKRYGNYKSMLQKADGWPEEVD